MIQLKNTLVSNDILEKKFVCDLQACQGICCVEGDSGAPLEKEELHILEETFENIKPFLRPEGIKAIESQGVYIVDEDGDYVTPLVDGKECAYTVFDENGTAACGIEKAWEAGKIDFRKPISCHLYPVRLTEYTGFTAVNYHRWDICSAACALGEKLNVPVYRFLREPLIRKFGQEWYDELELIAKEFDRSKHKKS